MENTTNKVILITLAIISTCLICSFMFFIKQEAHTAGSHQHIKMEMQNNAMNDNFYLKYDKNTYSGASIKRILMTIGTKQITIQLNDKVIKEYNDDFDINNSDIEITEDAEYIVNITYNNHGMSILLITEKEAKNG